MIKLIDILYEAKQVGSLYHFTNIKYLKNILNLGLKFQPDNSGLKQFENTFYISVTRDITGKGILKYMVSDSSTINVRIKLDGNKISEKYKIKPINIEWIWNGEEEEWEYTSKFPEFAEERIISSKSGYLNSNYILQIDTIIPKEDIDNEFIDKVNTINQF